MPDELDVRDDREEAPEEGGDDEVSSTVIPKVGRLGHRPFDLHPQVGGRISCETDSVVAGRNRRNEETGR